MDCKKIDVGYPVASERSSVSANKRKVDTEPESPCKRVRPAQLAVPAKKRKASPQRDTPRKRQRTGPECSVYLCTTVAPRSPRSPRSWKAKYLQLDLLGEGGFGSVYAGKRKADNLPVAIKHIHKNDVSFQPVVLYGKMCMVPLEVLLMIKAGVGASPEEKLAPVLLLDWYELEEEVLLVMERPVPCVSLFSYVEDNDGPLGEDFAKNIMKQLVDAALHMHGSGVFHRDIKAENLLIETGSDGPRLRVIDFGCGCVVQEEPYSRFSGTRALAPPEFFIHKKYEAVPTTAWQLGVLLFEILHAEQEFSTFTFLRGGISLSSELSQDCRKFLERCLTQSPKERATLEELQLHPWLQAAA